MLNKFVGIDTSDSRDLVRYKRITQMLTVLGALIFSAFLPFCFLYDHPAVYRVDFFVGLTLMACLLGIWLNTRKHFLAAKNGVSVSVLLLYTASPILLGTEVLDGSLLLVFPATLFFAYHPKERGYATSLVAAALLAYLLVLSLAQSTPYIGPAIPAELAFWVASASKLVLFVFIAVICYFAAQQIALNETALAEALAKSDALLLNILPPAIAERLKQAPEAIAERLKQAPEAIADRHDKVAVLFADIAHFTPLSESISPDALVALLNTIFSEFDLIARRHGVEKIKTIGDAYMAAAGVPNSSTQDLEAIALCALEMVQAAQKLRDPHGNKICLRLGLHYGPAVAGVIGAHKFAYDLWGDTVNTASRMESHGEVGKIHVSDDMYQVLKGRFQFEPRGEIDVKGKGRLKTWWLLS